MRRRRHENDIGQATVEAVLLVPFVGALVLVVLQAALVGRDQIAVVHAAREAARRAAVDPDPAGPRAAAREVLPGAVTRVPARRPAVGETVRVEVVYRSPTSVPVVGPLLPDVPLRAQAVMRVEQ